MIDLKSFNQLNFIGTLALYQNRRDSALGLSHITTKTRGLLWYYNLKRSELFREVSRAAFVQGATQQAQKRMNEIMAEAQKTKSKKKAKALLLEARQLQASLEKLVNGG